MLGQLTLKLRMNYVFNQNSITTRSQTIQFISVIYLILACLPGIHKGYFMAFL